MQSDLFSLVFDWLPVLPLAWVGMALCVSVLGYFWLWQCFLLLDEYYFEFVALRYVNCLSLGAYL